MVHVDGEELLKQKIASSYFAKGDFVLYFPYWNEPGKTGYDQNHRMGWLLNSITLLDHELGALGCLRTYLQTVPCSAVSYRNPAHAVMLEIDYKIKESQ